MTDHHDNDTANELDAIIDAHLLHLEGAGDRPRLDTLRPELRAQAAEQMQLLDASWGALVHDGDDLDAVARSLGLSSDPFALSGSKLRQARMSAGLDLKGIAVAIATIGVTGIDTSTLFDLEQSAAVWIDPDLASALAVALDVDAPTIASSTVPEPHDIDRFMASADFEATVAAWAVAEGRDPDAELSQVRRLVRSATYRAEAVDADHLEEILAAVLRARSRK
jgi:hypothetical protein